MKHTRKIALSCSVLVACLFAWLLPIPACAQEYRAQVSGVASDEKDARVSDANVTLTNTGTGIQRNTNTDPQGHYLFELVEPGTYSVRMALSGFAEFVSQNILVQSRANITVDGAMRVGGAHETVVVEAEAAQVDFTSANVQLTLDTKMVEDTPNFGRNPFLLAQLDSSVENDEQGAVLPYNAWGSNGLRVGGSSAYSNDLQVDGSPIGLGLKSSYIPNTDSVQEVTVQQNAVDAEFGNSSGGIISIALKSGTNDFHGGPYWTGRYPFANALDDRYLHTKNLSRQNIFGFNLGNPILKKKLFNFFSFENWRRTDPGSGTSSIPTALELSGDFSASQNSIGMPLQVYDPWTTVTSADGSTVTRQTLEQEYGTMAIPSNRQDPVARKLASALNWQKPNRTPDDPSGKNNWIGQSPTKTNYTNYSNRVDYTLNDKLSFNGRFSRFTAPAVATNGTGSSLVFPYSTNDEGTQLAGTMTFALNAKTVFDVHGDWHSMVDDTYPVKSVAGLDWSDLWAGQSFLSSVAITGSPSLAYPPRIEIDRGAGDPSFSFGDPGGYWMSHPEGHSIRGKVLHSFKSHEVKAGVEYRYEYGASAVYYTSGFAFNNSGTSNSYINADASKTGNGFATFLMGVQGEATDLSAGIWGGQSNIHQTPITTPVSKFWSTFVNDDWKVSRNLTMTLGLRYEYELPWTDPMNRGSRILNLAAQNPMLAANPAQIDSATLASIKQYYQGPLNTTNGQWLFTDSSHPGMWNNLATVFLPRVGMAYRVSDKTSVNAGWARWAKPWVQEGKSGNQLLTGSLLDVVYPGFVTDQSPAAEILGVPQVTLANPFPDSHPLVPAIGKGYGANLGLGQSNEYNSPNRNKSISDRMNVGVQRALPWSLVGKATYSYVFTHNVGWQKNVNSMDPRLYYTYKGALNVQVPNPFYDYGTSTTFPGGLRYQQTVSLSQLLKPYPQYGDLLQDWTPGNGSTYQSLAFQVQRPFRNGLSMLFDYNYHYGQDQGFFDDRAQYSLQRAWFPSGNSRHRISEAATWELPVGRNRQFLGGTPRLLDAFIGGWNLNDITTWSSGSFIQIQFYNQVSNPLANIPAHHYFNPAAFTRMTDYESRSNPVNQLPGLLGPMAFDVDASLNKDFALTERVNFRIGMTAFNAINRETPNTPDMNIENPTFGTSVGQNGNTTGRKLELEGKITF